MTILYIRHSTDNGVCTYSHDCDLTTEGKRLAREEGEKILKEYGLPSRIYVSPFHRTLQTVKAMLNGKETEIIKENRLSRYFSSREKKNPQVHSDTLQEDIPIYESYSKFKRRIRHFNTYVTRRKHNGVIWCVTHSTVYKQLAELNEKKIPSYIPFMHHITLKWCEKCETYH